MSTASKPEVAQPRLRDVAPNARHLSVSQIIRRLFRMAVLFVAARLLGVELFGVYVLLLTIVELVAVISGYAYMDFLTREVAKEPAAAWSLASRTALLRMIYALPSLVLAMLMLKLLRFSTSMVLNASLLGVTLAPRIVGESAQGVMKGLRLFAPLPWIELAQGVAVLGGAATLSFAGFGLRGIILAEILGAATGAIVATWSLRGHLRFAAWDVTGFSALVRSTFAFNVYPFIASVYDRVDVILLSKLAGSAAAGIYSIPYRAFATLQIIPYSLMGALLPAFSASSDKGEICKACAITMRPLFLISLLIILVTLAFAQPVILFLLGQSYAGSVVTIEILVWASVPAFLNFALNTVFLSVRNERVFLKTAAVCTAFNVIANLLLIPRFSFIAAAGVTVLTECLLLAQNVYLMKKLVGHAVFPKDGAKIGTFFLAVLAAFWGMQLAMPRPLAGALACGMFALGSAWTMRALWHPEPRTGSVQAIDHLNGSLSS
jgi:O-antigen/teichoic acid export membrane protein